MTAPSLGVTFACRDQFDAVFSLATTNAQIVGDEIHHRLTTDSVLGDSEDAVNWGINVFRRLGAGLGPSQVQSLGPELAAMLQQSPLIETADVVVTSSTTKGLTTLGIAVSVTPKHPISGDPAEALSFLFLLTPDTLSLVGDPDGEP